MLKTSLHHISEELNPIDIQLDPRLFDPNLTTIDWPLFNHWRQLWYTHWLASRRTQQGRAGCRAARDTRTSSPTPTGRVTNP